MPTEITRYDIVLSCPTDVEVEKEIIQSVIEDFNRTIGNNLNITLNLKHWSTDSYAQSGGPAQELLNQQFIDDSDMIICIFWGRMGTPTEAYESGTAEEMQKAIEKGKQVFLYFSNAPISPRNLDGEQFERVQAFEKKVQDMKSVYYKNYNNIEDFKNTITTDLNLYFLNMQQAEKDNLSNQNTIKSNLVVSGTEHKKIIENLSSYKNYGNFQKIIKKIKTDIVDNITQINEIKLIPKTIVNELDTNDSSLKTALSLMKKRKYQYSDEYISVITNFAETESVELNEDFFEVGDLEKQENLMYISGMNSRSTLIGSDEAKLKQEKINTLLFDIYEYLDWVEYSVQFKEINFIRLALSNKGTIFESDITVTLKFPSSGYIPFSRTRAPGQYIIDGVIEHEFISRGFGDFNSVEVSAYTYPVPYPVNQTMPKIPNFPGHSTRPTYDELKEDYYEIHEKLECFEEYEDEGFIIQKYHFDELKQHTSISFPIVLLFDDSCSNLKIDYEIISKNNPEKKIASIGMR